MITNIPAAEDYYRSGKELFDFAWDNISELVSDLDEAGHFGIEVHEVEHAYWELSRRRILVALTVVQQGVELVLKGRIAEVSPFLLIANTHAAWPKADDNKEIPFSKFKTIDAQDLIKIHNSVSKSKLDDSFQAAFDVLRERRNLIMHTASNNMEVQFVDVFKSILEMHKNLFPKESWANQRLEHLLQAPHSELGSADWATNRVCREIELVIGLLSNGEVAKYFGAPGGQRRYLCPTCFNDFNRDAGDLDIKLAALKPKGPKSTLLYCPICDITHTVIRRKCSQKTNGKACPGNVLFSEEKTAPWAPGYNGFCLTCGEENGE